MNTHEDSKKCKECYSDIPIKAKKCTKCMADQRSWVNRHPIISFLAVIIFVPILVTSIFSDSGTTANNNVDSGSSEPTSTQPILDIVSIDTKVTEQNSVWWKYSWIFKVKNNSDRDHVVNAHLEWLDKEGYVVETALEYSLTIPANQEKTFSGYELIDIQVAPTVGGIQVNLK